METLVITPRNKNQAQKIVTFVNSLGLYAGTLSKNDKEDAAMLKAIREVEQDKSTVPLDVFLKKLRG